MCFSKVVTREGELKQRPPSYTKTFVEKNCYFIKKYIAKKCKIVYD